MILLLALALGVWAAVTEPDFRGFRYAWVEPPTDTAPMSRRLEEALPCP